MEINLINGMFDGKDAVDLISEMVKVKILFLENKINATSSEEEIKMREKRIKQLQNDLKILKEEIATNSSKAKEMLCTLTINS
ncbi:MAG: hypothetical protein ACK5B9_13255 [Flavobacteriia bacterium]